MHPEDRSIDELAYRLWQARGCPEGSAEQDWLDAERQLDGKKQSDTGKPVQSAQRAAPSAASDAIDSALKESFPASDPPASHRIDEPPANAGAKWKAAGASRNNSATGRSRQPKSAQSKPSTDPPI